MARCGCFLARSWVNEGRALKKSRLAGGAIGLATDHQAETRELKAVIAALRGELEQLHDRLETAQTQAAVSVNAEIAQMLAISKRTVETHRASIMTKVGLKSRAELVHFAVENGLWRPAKPA